MMLRQDPNNAEPQKLGTFNPRTWAAYLLNGELFVKRTDSRPGEAPTRISAARSRRSPTRTFWRWRRWAR